MYFIKKTCFESPVGLSPRRGFSTIRPPANPTGQTETVWVLRISSKRSTWYLKNSESKVKYSCYKIKTITKETLFSFFHLFLNLNFCNLIHNLWLSTKLSFQPFNQFLDPLVKCVTRLTCCHRPQSRSRRWVSAVRTHRGIDLLASAMPRYAG